MTKVQIEIKIPLKTNDLRTGSQIMKKMLKTLNEQELEILGEPILSKTLEEQYEEDV